VLAESLTTRQQLGFVLDQVEVRATVMRQRERLSYTYLRHGGLLEAMWSLVHAALLLADGKSRGCTTTRTLVDLTRGMGRCVG